MKRILEWILVMSCLLILICCTTNNVNFDNTVIGNIYRYRPVIVVTGSMVPTIEVNSISIMYKCSIDDIEERDIVIYKTDNGLLITHRVMEVINTDTETFLKTKGDNNEYSDIDLVSRDQVQGKIIKTYNGVAPYINKIMGGTGNISGLAILKVVTIGVILTWVIVMTILYIRNIMIAGYWGLTSNKGYEEKIYEIQDNLRKQDKFCDKLKDMPKNETNTVRKIRGCFTRASIIENFRQIDKELEGIKRKIK